VSPIKMVVLYPRRLRTSAAMGEKKKYLGKSQYVKRKWGLGCTYPPPKYITCRPVDCSLVMLKTVWK